MKAKFRCAACCLRGQRDCDKPPAAFGAHSPAEILSRIVRHGAWARCLACRDLADQCRAGAGKPSLAETELARAPPTQPEKTQMLPIILLRKQQLLPKLHMIQIVQQNVQEAATSTILYVTCTNLSSNSPHSSPHQQMISYN